MNFSFYIYGTPNSYNQYPSDNNRVLLKEFAQNNTTESQLTVYRKGQLVYYSYLQRLQGKSNQYIGFCLLFTGVYCRDTKLLFDLFDKAFSDITLKGEILQMGKNGKISFAIENFINKQLEIKRIESFFQNSIKKIFSKDFTTLSPSFKVGNGTKKLSVNDNNSDISTAICQYDCVHISNNEKSDSELDRIHKKLADLYAEKLDLNTKYKRLLGQKKQYKVIILLFLALIICILGLVAFNNNLQSKDSKIQSLEVELKEKYDTIKFQHSNITQLQITQSKLNSEVSNLKKTVSQKNTIIDEKIAEIQYLNHENSSLNLRINSLGYEIRNLKTRNQELSSENTNIKKLSPQKYKVIASQAFCYNWLGGKFKNTKYYYSNDVILYIYTTKDEHGLSQGGWLKLSDLEKY